VDFNQSGGVCARFRSIVFSSSLAEPGAPLGAEPKLLLFSPSGVSSFETLAGPVGPRSSRGEIAQLDRYIEYYKPYSTSRAELDTMTRFARK
jgi:hypothetical protein